MTDDDDDFWGNRFHHCALAAGFLAASVDRLGDSRYVQRLAYELYERGAFRVVAVNSLTTALNCPIAEALLTRSLSSHASQVQEDQAD